MAFSASMSTTTALADNLILLWKKEFFISGADEYTKGLDSLVTHKDGFKGKTQSFTEYTKQTVITSALTEDTVATNVAMADTAHTITPAEYGNVVQTTNLVELQTDGQAGRAAVRLAAINAAESQEKLLILAGEAGTNEITVNATNEASTTASNIITPVLVDRMYNKMKRSGIPKIQNSYWAVLHDDVIHDLRAGTAAGTWTDINKYDNSMEVRTNEVGMYGGFRIISSPLVTVNTDAGDSAVDTYHSMFFGFNAFGKAVSQPVALKITGPFDNLERFVNIGWYGVFKYGIVDSNALWILTGASSIGSNT